MRRRCHKFFVLAVMAALVAGCGSSGGTDNPPPPPAPVTPPPPAPEPTFAERLQEWADMDPNPCRARTPGFEALGGWLKDDGRDVGTSRVWARDNGLLAETDSHGARVWRTFSDCAVRSDDGHYTTRIGDFWRSVRADGGDAILLETPVGVYDESVIPEPGVWWEFDTDTDSYHNVDCGDGRERCGRLDVAHDGTREGQRVLRVHSAGKERGEVTNYVYSGGYQLALQDWRTALVIIAGGYSGTPESGEPASGSSICGGAEVLCLFGRYDSTVGSGTSHTAPMLAAALDSVWAVWPEMDVLDLRNLAFDCAQNRDPRAGESSTERTFEYSNGRSFKSSTNPTWGHGVFSLTCLFTPNGGLQDPTTGNPISGGIYGPVAGPVTGASITGVDYTGRDFGYGFAHPVARENFALVATANLRPIHAIPSGYAYGYRRAAVRGRLWGGERVSVNLNAAGNAFGVTTLWQAGNLTVQSGIAAQPEGVGALTGSRSFRAPSTVSAAITAAYGRALPYGFSAHLQADHWQTLSTQGRSLWQSAKLFESRITAALVKRAGNHEFALQGAWQSGLAGSLEVDGQRWPVAGVRERGAWLTWTYK